MWVLQQRPALNAPGHTEPGSPTDPAHRPETQQHTGSLEAAAAETNIPPEMLSVWVRPVMDEQGDYLDRLSAAALVATTNLTSTDQEALYDFLLKRSPLDEDQRGHVLKNELLNGLCETKPPPVGLGGVLERMYRDPNQHIVVRDYAVQHLVALYEGIERASENDRLARASEAARVRELFWEALSETDNSIAGTALLGLAHLSGNRREFDRDRLAAAAVDLAREESTGELTRITALQVSAQLGVREMIPVLMQIAQESQSISLRISAIGALGTLRATESLDLLNTILGGPEQRLKLPAGHAVVQIESR